ncbi:MAG: DUF3810 domain-containing protein [Clostridium sp.]|jgi:hypothetical protein|nr:DUF3810 domain-containing protein [Clostridium sp.]
MKKKQWFLRRSFLTYSGILAGTVALNLLARSSTAFSDLYIEWIFPIWINTLGRFMGIFPFSVGEILIGAGLLYAASAVAVALLLSAALAVGAVGRWKSGARMLASGPPGGQEPGARKLEARILASGPPGAQPLGEKYRGLFRFGYKFYLGFAWSLLILFLLLTLGGFLLYHGSTFAQRYFPAEGETYTAEELIAVRNFVVEQCNRLSAEMSRDEAGNVLYAGNMTNEAIESMLGLGQTYERLNGYYPPPKPLLLSDFCCQQYIQGYFFPFSMEANYNRVMYLANKPATLCHELAHMRGYILEDEANFIGFLACVSSDDAFFQYSGYLSVLNYLDNDFYRLVGRDRARYMQETAILPQVVSDNVFVTSAEWERIEKHSLLETEAVDAATDLLMDTNLKANGVSDGKLSYSRVVQLVLQYYKQLPGSRL